MSFLLVTYNDDEYITEIYGASPDKSALENKIAQMRAENEKFAQSEAARRKEYYDKVDAIMAQNRDNISLLIKKTWPDGSPKADAYHQDEIDRVIAVYKEYVNSYPSSAPIDIYHIMKNMPKIDKYEKKYQPYLWVDDLTIIEVKNI